MLGLFTRNKEASSPLTDNSAVVESITRFHASSELVNSMAQEVSLIASDVSKTLTDGLGKQLERSYAKFSSTIDLIPDIIIVKDAANRWMTLNSTGKKFFGFIADEWKGKTSDELADKKPEFASFFEISTETDRRAWKDGTAHYRKIVVTDPKNPRIYDVMKSAVYDEYHNRQELISVWRDVTDLCDPSSRPEGCPLNKNIDLLTEAGAIISDGNCARGSCTGSDCGGPCGITQ